MGIMHPVLVFSLENRDGVCVRNAQYKSDTGNMLRMVGEIRGPAMERQVDGRNLESIQ